LRSDQGLEVIPIINKVDLPNIDIDLVREDLRTTLGFKDEEILLASGKTGQGVAEILNAVVDRVPPPSGDQEAPLRALIFDSHYDAYKGVVAHVRIVDGSVRQGDRILLMATGKEAELLELGVFAPNAVPIQRLATGEVGYVATGLKTVADCRVGDTLTLAGHPAREPLPGYRPAKPMVFAGFFPVLGEEYPALRDALEKLRLNDASLIYEPENSQALGFGFRAGFLGLLHLDIVQERLEREYDVDLIATSPSVEYRVITHTGEIAIDNPAKLPDPGTIIEVREPWMKVTIIVPQGYVGPIMDLSQGKRGVLVDMSYVDPTRAMLIYDMPLAEVIVDFYDQLKSRSQGYASLDYELREYRAADLVRLDILVAGTGGRRALDDRAPRALVGHRPRAHREAARADPEADVRRPDPGGHRREGDRARDGEGEAQGRAGQVLRRRHHPEEEAAREAEGRQEAHEDGRRGRDPAGGVPRRAADQGGVMRPYRVAFEHPTQLLASTFLRALAENDGPVVWERLSRESRGLLEGRYAAGARIALHRAASIEADGADARLAEVTEPVRESALGVIGGPEKLLSLGVSAARLVDRGVAYVLLLPEFGE